MYCYTLTLTLTLASLLWICSMGNCGTSYGADSSAPAAPASLPSSCAESCRYISPSDLRPSDRSLGGESVPESS